MSQPRFELVKTASGAVSILDCVMNEIMHSQIGPWKEANSLYIEPSQLRDALRQPAQGASDVDVVVFDVGLGAAANALAAISAALLMTDGQRRLQVVSYEIDLSLLAFTLEQAQHIPYVQGFVPELRTLMANHCWRSPCGRVSWDLRVGDFREMIRRETWAPDFIFFEPYSPRRNPDMWNMSCFQRLHAHCGATDRTATLYTYSMATHVKTALLLAGFYVGHGPATGLKKETTQASTCLAALASPLDERWLIRWLRSHIKWPNDVGARDVDRCRDLILSHPQFTDLVWQALYHRPNLLSGDRLR